MSERDITYLLRKYETRQPGEAINTEMLREEKRKQRLNEKRYILDTLNTTIHLSHNQKERAQYIIERIKFEEYNNCTYEQVILTIMIYIRKADYPSLRLTDYNTITNEYELSDNKFKAIMIRLLDHKQKGIY